MKKVLILALKYSFISAFFFSSMIFLINTFSKERQTSTKVCEVIFSSSKETNETLNTVVKEETCHAK